MGGDNGSTKTVDDQLMELLGIEDRNGNDEDDLTVRRDGKNGSTFRRVKTSVFMVLYLMAKDRKVGWTGAYAQALISMVQMVYFAFGSKSFKWHMSISDAVIPGLEIFNFEMMNHMGDSVVLISFSMALGLLGTTYALCFWIGSSFFTHGTVHHLWILPIVQFLMRLLTTVLYLPILTVLNQIFSCSDPTLDNLLPCHSTSRIIAMIVIALIMVIFVTLNCIVALVFVENNPTSSTNVMTQVHGRVDCVYMIVGVLLSFSFALTGKHEDDNAVPLVALVVSSGFITTSLYLLYLPYWQASINRLMIATNAIYLWAGISLLVAEVIQTRDDHAGILSFLLGFIPAACTSLWLAQRREAYLANSVVRRGMSVYTAELVMRYKVNPVQSPFQDVKKEYENVLEEIFPNSAYMMVNFACIADKCGKNEVLSSQLMRRAKCLKNIELDQSFLVFQFLQRHRERNNGTVGGALSYVAFTHHRTAAEQEILTLLDLKKQLWKLIAAPELTKDSQLLLVASNIQRHSESAKEHLNALLTVSNGSKKALLLYEVYAREIINDVDLATSLKRAADRVKLDEDDTIAAVTISAETESIGKIQSATDGMEELFGVTKEQLLGKNISFLCPPPFDAIHDMILKRYLDTSTSFNAVERPVWGRNVKTGYALPVLLKISCNQDANGRLTFTGTFSMTKDTTKDFMCIDEKGKVLFFSEGAAKTFKVSNVGVENNICTIVPDLLPDGREIGAIPNGSKLTVKYNGRQLDLSFERLEFKTKELGQYQLTMVTVEIEKQTFEAPISLKVDELIQKHKAEEDEILRMNSTGAASTEGRDSSDAHEADRKLRKSFSQPTSSFKVSAESKLDLKPRKPANVVPVSPAEDDDELSSKPSSRCSTRTQNSRGLSSVVQERVKEEQKRLSRFWKLCRSLTMLFLALSIASLYGQGVFFSNFHDTVSLVKASSYRSFVLAKLAMVQIYKYNGLVKNVFQNNSSKYTEATINDELLRLSGELRSTHELLMRASGTKTDMAQMELLSAPNAIRTTFDGVHFESISLHNAMMKLSVFAMDSAIGSGDGASFCKSSCEFILNNALFETMEGSRESSRLYTLHAMGTLDNAVIFNNVITCIALVAVITVITFKMFPLITELDATVRKLLTALELIPQIVVDDLNKKSKKQKILVANKIATINGERSYKENVHLESTKHLDLSSLANQFNPKVMPLDVSARGKFRTSKASKLLLVAKMALPLIFVPGYFLIIRMLAVTTRTEASSYVGTLFWTGRLRTTQAQLMNSFFPLHQPSTFSRWYQEPEVYNLTENKIKFLEELKNQFSIVQYGRTEGLEISAIPLADKDRYPAQYKLLYDSACPECVNDTLADDFLATELVHGLYAAIERLIEKSRTAIQEKEGTLPINYASIQHLAATIHQSMELYEQALQEYTQQTTDRILLATLIFSLGSTCIAVVFYKTFAKMTKDVQRAQYLLLMLPPEVVIMPKLKQLFRRRSSLLLSS